MTEPSVASGLRWRVLLPIAVAMALLLATFAAIFVVETGNRQAEDLARTAASVEVMAREEAAEGVRATRSLMELTMRDRQLESALRAHDRQALLEASAPILQEISARNRITHFYYILPDRTVLLRVHHPDKHGDKIERFVLLEAERTGKPSWGNEQGPLGSFTLRVVYPWHSDGELIGYLEMGIEFEDLMLDIKSFLDVDVFVSIDKTFFDRAKWDQAQAKKKHPVAWDEFPSVVVLSRTTPEIPPPIANHLASRAGQRTRRTFESSWDEHVAQIVILPFANLRGQELGELVVLRDITGSATERRRAIVGVALLGAVIGGVLMGLFYVLLGRVQRDVAVRTLRLTEARRVLTVEQLERQRAERELGLQQERNQLLEEQSRMARERLAALKALEDRTHELAGSLSLLGATLESTADGILATRLSGAVICSNDVLRTMWGIPPEVLARGSSVELLDFIAPQTADPEEFVARARAIVAAPEVDAFDVILLEDGRVFERYCKPQRIDGEIVGMVVNFRDITERRRAESELASVHAQLVDVSRQAGMAEIATDVLHSVGNALNNVNVSATLVIDAIRASHVPGLARAAAVLREHSGDLGTFLERDPRGKQFPVYISELATLLASEQESALEELSLLGQSIDHIKSIVAAQQQFTTPSSLKEDVDLGELLGACLRVNDGDPTHDGVEVVRDWKASPRVRLEKHKLAQILINLIRNARRACLDSDRSDKRMTLRVRQNGRSVQLSVIDNGVGIPPENLTRIFNHGFTTRKDSLGFGLHCAALAARQLGGELRVHSDGPGRGATFTLDLPIEPSA